MMNTVDAAARWRARFEKSAGRDTNFSGSVTEIGSSGLINPIAWIAPVGTLNRVGKGSKGVWLHDFLTGPMPIVHYRQRLEPSAIDLSVKFFTREDERGSKTTDDRTSTGNSP